VTLDPAALIDGMREVLATGPPLRLAILFGSAARGRMHADSDVDVGIGPVDAGLSLAAELDLQARLEAACGRPVDLVRLDRASTLLRWEAARTAVLITASAAHELPRFLASAALEHADLMTTLGGAAERFRLRLAQAYGPSPTDRESTEP
jgi:predicted nucleotidyltransferase